MYPRLYAPVPFNRIAVLEYIYEYQGFIGLQIADSAGNFAHPISSPYALFIDSTLLPHEDSYVLLLGEPFEDDFFSSKQNKALVRVVSLIPASKMHTYIIAILNKSIATYTSHFTSPSHIIGVPEYHKTQMQNASPTLCNSITEIYRMRPTAGVYTISCKIINGSPVFSLHTLHNNPFTPINITTH